jgi:AGCS family alanine or glycine:cation symporter
MCRSFIRRGNAFQSNQAAAKGITRFGLEGSHTGTVIDIIFAVAVGIVILGGIKRIAKVTEKAVPFTALIYVLAELIIIISQLSILDDALMVIFSEAFSPRATAVGGSIGVIIQKLRRAALSNDEGAGSASIAYAAVITKYPASEGLETLLEPFIDTVLICTMTAVVIIMFNMVRVFI